MQHKADTAAPAVEAPRLAYSIDRLADASDIGRTMIYEAIRSGQLKAKKVGSRTIITAPAAAAYLDALPDKAA